MKVVILAGGMGTRLAEETDVKPKPMVEIGGRPILWHIMQHYSSYGFNEFVICLGYKGEYIKRYMMDYAKLTSDLTVKLRTGDIMRHGQGAKCDWTIDLVDTGITTATAGRIKRVQHLIGNSAFMVTYGDGVSNVNIKTLLEFHRKHGKAGTLTAVRPPARFGNFHFEGDIITEFIEKPQAEAGWINGGFLVLEPEIFKYISTDDTWLEREPLETLAKKRELCAYKHEGFWQCMDTLRDKRYLEELWDKGQAPWKVGPEVTYDYAIVGGGIVGLSVGMALTERHPGARVVVIEKEDHWAAHQTGHNSGVIHSGIYYKPGSYKARFAIEGARLIPEFCKQHGITHDVCGKIIVATEQHELPLLENLLKRGFEHGLPIRKISPEQIKEIEPHCAGLAGIEVKSTGIADYKKVAATYARLIEQRGGELKLGCRVTRFIHQSDGIAIETTGGTFKTRFLVNCAGLHCDRVARLDNVDPQARIVPFRGEYYELTPEKRYLVKNLIYPVPNPDFPFLGVHYTRMADGNIHCGPNAVLALKREGYSWGDISLRDMWDSLTYKGFWNLARKNFGEGMTEIYRSFSKKAFTRSLQRLIPEVREADLVPSHAGVRAQALMPDGKMVDDFLIVRGENSVHVCNAPSPAATASIPIGRAVVEQLPQPVRTQVAVPA